MLPGLTRSDVSGTNTPERAASLPHLPWQMQTCVPTDRQTDRQSQCKVPVRNPPGRQGNAPCGSLGISSLCQGLGLEPWGDRPRSRRRSGISRGQQTGEIPARRGPSARELLLSAAGPGELQGSPFGPLLPGPQGMGVTPSHVSPWPHLGPAAPVTVGEQGCCGIQGSTVISKAVDKTPGGGWTAAAPGSRGCF